MLPSDPERERVESESETFKLYFPDVSTISDEITRIEVTWPTVWDEFITRLKWDRIDEHDDLSYDQFMAAVHTGLFRLVYFETSLDTRGILIHYWNPLTNSYTPSIEEESPVERYWHQRLLEYVTGIN